MRTLLHTIGLSLAVLGATLGVAQAQAPTQKPSELFTRQEAMIPMRDGVKLYTEIYVPKSGTGPFPVILTRTPYGVRGDAEGYNMALVSSYKELAADGYIFVCQDKRAIICLFEAEAILGRT